MGNVRDFVVNILGEDRTEKVWQTFQANAGKAAAGAAAAFAGAKLGEAILGDLDAEVATDKINAALSGTPAESEKWAKAAGSLYRDAWGESMEEAAGAVETVVSSIEGMRNASEGDIKQASAYAIDFAKVFEVDVADAATNVGLLMKNGLAKDTTEAFDLMTAGMEAVPKALRGEVSEATQEYGSVLSNLGFTGEQAIGLLVSSTEDGSYGVDKMGDALKELSIRSTDMSTTSVAAYEAAGLNAEDMAARFLAGGDTAQGAMTDLTNGLLSIEDPVKRSNAAIGLFGTPLEDLGVNEIPKFLEGLQNTGGALGDVEGRAATMSDTLNDNAKTRVQELRRSFDGWTQDLIETEGPIGDVAVAAQAFGADAAALATSVGLGVIALSQLKLGALATRGATLLSAAATGIATAAQRGMNLAMRANPIGLIITAIGLLVAGLVWFFTETEVGQKIIKGAWAGIKRAMSAVTTWWRDTAWPAIKSTWNKVTGAFSDGKAKIGRFMNQVGDVIKRVWAWSPLGLVINNWSRIMGWLRAAPGRIAGYFRSLPGRIGGALRNMFDPLWTGFKAVANNLIYGWNSLSFTLGGGSIAGINVPSITLSTPNIPYLASGGIVTAATLAMIGEGRGPEAVVPLDRVGEFIDNVSPSGGRHVEININQYNPIAEPTSVSTNKGLQYAAALGVGL